MFATYRTMDLFQATGIVFSCENTLAALEGTDISCPLPADDLIALYLDSDRTEVFS
jgi:hypothetical protein